MSEFSGKILNDLILLRKKIGGLQAKKVAGGPQFPVKNARDLMFKVRDAADELLMPMCGSPVSSLLAHEPTERGTKVHVTVTIRFMSSDGSYVDFTGVGSGIATDDKGAGKASTYAWKEAFVKALSLPDADMVDADDDTITAEVLELVGLIESIDNIDELKGLKPRLEKLSEGEREPVMKAYIKAAARFKK